MKGLITAASLLASAGAFGQFSVPPSSSDALDVSQGTTLTSSTPGIAPAPDAAFGGNPGGPEPGTCFCPDVGLGNSCFIEVSTPSRVSLSSARLYAKNDGIGALFRRAMQGFRLFADTDDNGSYETTVVSVHINPDYDNEPNNLAIQSEYLELEFAFGPVNSQRWRAEFEQGAQIGLFEGIRIIEVDGFGEACYADCDTSTGPGVLDIFDFLCFQNRYSVNDPYACGCDSSTGPGVCDIFDFLCFQNAFAAGCP